MPKEPEAGVNLKIPSKYWQEFHKRKEQEGKPIKVQVVEAFRAYLYPGGEQEQVVRTGSTGSTGTAPGQNPGPTSPRGNQEPAEAVSREVPKRTAPKPRSDW